jgi:hypothetical protein
LLAVELIKPVNPELSTTPTKITMNPRYKGYKEIF